MSRIFKMAAKSNGLLAMVMVGLLLFSFFLGCSPRFKPGDKVGVPPLPPSDSLIGIFDKTLSSDLSGNVYRLRDLPDNGPMMPVGLNFNGKYRLFFLYQDVIRMGTMQPASPYIDTGPDGIADSGLGFDDVQEKPVGQTGLTGLDVVVGPGPNSKLETLVPKDANGNPLDTVVTALVPGRNGIADTIIAHGGCGATDVLSTDGKYCLPGPDGTLEIVPDFGTDDKIGQVIVAGPNGVADSGLGTGDIQRGAAVVEAAKEYSSRVGIMKRKGEPNRKAIVSSNGGLPSTVCVYDDNTRYTDKYKTMVENVEANTRIVHIDQTDGIYTGLDGIAQSGLGVNDEQIISLWQPITDPNGFIIRSKNYTSVTTAPIGNYDIQVYAPGTSGLSKDTIVVSPGPGGKLHTCPLGDDYVIEPQILSGSNICFTTAVGDDVQLLPVGLDMGNSGLPCIGAGPNQVLDTVGIAGDYWNNVSQPYIVAGLNGRVDTIVSRGDDRQAVLTGAQNLIAETGIGGDDIQIISAGIVTPYPLPIVAPGTNGVLDTPRMGDDVEMVFNLGWPLGGNACTAAAGNDWQVVPIGDSTLNSGVLFPVVLPGPDGVIDAATKTNVAGCPGEVVVIAEYGWDFNTFVTMVFNAYAVDISGYGNPYTNGVLESGLGGRGALDTTLNTVSPVLLSCTDIADTYDNGYLTLGGPADPYTLIPSYDQCKPRKFSCPDDCQKASLGSTVTQDTIIINGGFNGYVDTFLGGDDFIGAIIDGGDGIAESGLASADTQIIPAGRGLPNTVSIIAARDQFTGMVRQLTTKPAGDDRLIIPGVGDLAGTPPFVYDNKDTETDPDGDKRVENYATVDDGEYFSWETTKSVDTSIPPASVNVPFDSIMPDGNGIVSNRFSFNAITDPSNGNSLIAYVSNGMNIYRLTSADGVTWALSPANPILIPGNNGTETDPVVLAGVDGICDTAAASDDVQAIPVGQGRPNSIAIFAGKDGVLQSTRGGDDKVDGLFIRTGANGINESTVGGDDWEMIPFGQGQPDSACILAGPNGKRDTSDGSIVLSDDRPPFMDINGNSASTPNFMPEATEPSVSQNGSAGFDAFAVTDPYIFVYEGKYYMFFTGWGALDEPEAQRPDDAALKVLGPCMSPGMDRRMNNKNLLDTVNPDNTPGVIVAPRIGLATSSDGINWTKKSVPMIDIGHTCAGLFDLSILSALGLDLSSLGIDPKLVSGGDFDISGVFAPRVRSDNASDGEPVFSIIYTGLSFRRKAGPVSDALSALGSMMPDAITKREIYAGTKTGLGMARSFTLTNGWEKLKTNNPVFSGGMFYSQTEEQFPTITAVGEGYMAYYGQLDSKDSNDDTAFIALGTRQGTVYSLCSAIKNGAKTSPVQAAMVLLLMLLPAGAILLRKVWVKVRNRN